MRKSNMMGALGASAMLGMAAVAAPAGAPEVKAPRRRPRGPRVLANLSRKHPDYGMTPQEHEAQKAKRKSK